MMQRVHLTAPRCRISHSLTFFLHHPLQPQAALCLIEITKKRAFHSKRSFFKLSRVVRSLSAGRQNGPQVRDRVSAALMEV